MCVYFLSQGLADNTVIAKVNQVVWDLDRPLEEDCTLELLKFEDEEAQAVSFYSVVPEFQDKGSRFQFVPAPTVSGYRVYWCLIVISFFILGSSIRELALCI